MGRKALQARLLRALTGRSQEQVAEALGVHHSLIGHFERGRVVPGREHLEGLAAEAGLTVREAEEMLKVYEAFRRSPQARNRGAGDLLAGLAEGVRADAEAVFRRVLRLPVPAAPPGPGDRRRADELWARLESLSEDLRLAVVRVAEEFQTWSLCEKVCVESETEASRDVERAAGLARLAQEIAERAPGPAGWRDRLRGYAAAHAANALRVSGDLEGADAAFESATRLWLAGSDPAGVLDPGRLPDLEASLRRAQRRFDEALGLLAEALATGRSPARALIKKGFTLEVMGEHEHALDTLLQAVPLVVGQGDRRLENILHCNLAFTFCHLCRFAEAAELAGEVSRCAAEMGDEIGALRGLWLEGRIAAGLGQPVEALRLLARARQEFAARNMDYDVALALLDEAALLLDEGRTAEVKALAEELVEVFKSKGVHREALAALRVFHQAAEREEATAEMARRVLGYLFRARHDEGLPFES